MSTGKKQEVAQVDGAVDLSTLAGQQGVGQGDMSMDDIAIPRLQILQQMSPQLDQDEAEYIEGAKAGMILNTASGEIYDGKEGFEAVIVHFRNTKNEWGLRESGGGFIADHGSNYNIAELCTRDDKNRDINKDGNQIVNTNEYFVYMLKDGDITPAILSMQSTMLKVSKKLNFVIDKLKIDDGKGGKVSAPIFAKSYIFKTVKTSNEQGSWFIWDFDHGKLLTEIPGSKTILEGAIEDREKIEAGALNIAPPVADNTGDSQEVGEVENFEDDGPPA